MVGILIVSHSKLLADGVKELTEQMTQGKVPIEVAGGIDDEENPIGTDPMKVMAALETLDMAADDGILVMMDLGSALMSAETALDFIDDELKKKIRLCAAPLVEGTVAAAVQASVGASLDEVASEALAALIPKAEQLFPVTGDPVPGSQVAAPPEEMEGELLQTRMTVKNPMGLHARPAANFVSVAGGFQSTITIEKGGKTASAKSINQVATLAVRCDEEITVTAQGPDAPDAIAAIKALHADHFGERIEDLSYAPEAVSPRKSGLIKDGIATGIPASPGVAAGPVRLYQSTLPEIETRTVTDIDGETARLDTALALAMDDIAALAKEAERTAGKENAAIFKVHQLILKDPEMRATAMEKIRKASINADAAWNETIENMAGTYRNLQDPYMQARAADVMDAGGRVLRHLVGETAPSLVLEKPAIVIAHDLLPSDVAGLDPGMVLAMGCEVGGSTSHAAILARSLGIPAVVGASGILTAVSQETVVVLDGDNGTLELAPDGERIARVAAMRNVWIAEKEAAKAQAKEPGITTDGIHLHVAANIGIPADAPRAFEHGAEGVGLFRTEFLFQERDTAPTEDEQVEAYLAAAEAMGGHPVIIRTLDAGGDKPLSYMEMKNEENPFLGERGIRLSLNRPDVFRPQLRALIRASRKADIKIMLPMVAHPAELLAAKALIQEAACELTEEGVKIGTLPPIGIMIEVPSAVAMADLLAKEADFFSIGTNDLTQYVMAADRGNAAVSGLSDNLHPAVLRMVKFTVDAAHKEGIPVGMCGELAGQTKATPLLLGMGLDELSMNVPSIPEVKKNLRTLSKKECEILSDHALTLADGNAVRAFLDTL
ncbi:MAG: phosphoenolpyruvate--protein phosphotransferase [Desulfobacteraceae bacterium]|nr:phosphoenolpyruvate--protein phosphotransferase [Desulfobacteraceae bacterium]